MQQQVEVQAVAASPTAVVAAATTWEEFPTLWGVLLDEVYAFVRAGGATQTGHNVMLYRDGVPNVEVGVQVDGPFPPTGRVVPSELPAGRVARTVHRGSYDGIGGAHEAVLGWCRANGHRTTGLRWEVYGDWQEDPAELETEVAWMLGPT
jgi:effector-binding domain-containing protein